MPYLPWLKSSHFSAPEPILLVRVVLLIPRPLHSGRPMTSISQPTAAEAQGSWDGGFLVLGIEYLIFNIQSLQHC